MLSRALDPEAIQLPAPAMTPVLAGALVALALALLVGGDRGTRGTRGIPPIQGGGSDPETAPTEARSRSPQRLTVDDVASTMVLLSVALRSGCGLVEAVEAVARVSDRRVAADLRSVAAAQRWGFGAHRAWTAVDPGWTPVARVLSVAGRAGLPPSALLIESARDLRAAELAALDVAGARVAVRLVLPLGTAFLPAFALTTVVPLVIALSAQLLA